VTVLDEIALSLTGVGSAVVAAGRSGNRVILDVFGGRASQIRGAINVDIVATSGVRASATRLPFQSGVADEIIASNPFIPGSSGGILDFLPSVARVLKPGGRFVLNATKGNPFGKLPSDGVLKSLGLRVAQQNGPLPSRLKGLQFRRTDGSLIPPESVRTTILEKVAL
jgi:filamentous hemagglutinin